jgi:hypothetical protein
MIAALVAAAMVGCGGGGGTPAAATPAEGQTAEAAGHEGHDKAGHEGHMGHGEGHMGHGEGHMGHGEGHEGHAGGHPGLPPELDAFHGVLAPLWHDESADRTAKTCTAVGELDTRATAIAAAPVPTGADAAAWQKGGADLKAAVAALRTECSTAARARFQPTFSALHEAFHHMMELLPHG